MDALQLLKTDHDAVRDLFEQFKQAKDAVDTARMGELQRAWAAKMTVLIENVEHHAEEEEEELFPQLRSAFGDERLERMGEKLAAAKRRRGAEVRDPAAAGIADLTRDELYERAQQLDIEGRASMTKEELAAAIAQHA